MKIRQPLFSATPEALGGGAAVSAVIPAAAQEAEAPASEAPGFLQSIKASLQSKTVLLGEVEQFKSRALAAEQSLATAQADLTATRASLATLQQERAEIAQALAASQQSATTVEAAAATVVAGMGFAAAELPAAETTPIVTRASLEAELDKETDPQRIVILARQIDALAR